MCRTIVLTVLLCFTVSVADDSAGLDEQLRDFERIPNKAVLARTPAEHWSAIGAIESFLIKHPDTFLRADATRFLLRSYGQVVDDPVFLRKLASETLELGTPRVHEDIAAIYLAKGILPEEAVNHAEKALELASETHEKMGNYALQATRARRLLSRALQASGRGKEALDQMRIALAETQAQVRLTDDLSTQSVRRDTVRLELLDMLVQQGKWNSAYELATALLLESKIRSNIHHLWMRAYTGKHGSAGGIGKAYAAVESDRRKMMHGKLISEDVKAPAPPVAFRTLSGDIIELRDLKGRIVILSFWAGWCGPCLEELAALHRINGRFPPDSIVILAVNVDTGREVERRTMIEGQMALRAPSLEFILGDSALQEQFGNLTLPFSCVIDVHGNVRFRNVGFEWDGEEYLSEQVEYLRMQD